MGLTMTVMVDGMSCASCVRHVERALTELPGVSVATVDLALGSARVEYVPEAVTAQDVLHAVRDLGYGAKLVESSEGSLGAA
jgi:Cu+-exporting ATPase